MLLMHIRNAQTDILPNVITFYSDLG